MKAIYIPKGESKTYENIVTDDLIVEGHIHVACGIKAKHISGHGIITAGTVSADIITADEIECGTIVCRRLMSKRVEAAEVFASDSAVISCFISAAYVETGRLVTSISELDEVKAKQNIRLKPNQWGMLVTLLLSAIRSFWIFLTMSSPQHNGVADTTASQTDGVTQRQEEIIRSEIARVVREVMAEQLEQGKEESDETDDFELKRIVATFKLLREQGYTLRIKPGTPEENAPILDLDSGDMIRPAA